MRNLTISIAFYSKIASFSDFKNIEDFFEKPIYFFKKTQILNVLRNFTISVAFAIIWWKKIQTREQPMLARLRELNWQTSG